MSTFKQNYSKTKRNRLFFDYVANPYEMCISLWGSWRDRIFNFISFNL